MIECRNLRKSFGSVVAVRDVSFAAKDASITGLLGHNGAGKTTTLRMLSTALAPESGQALIDGHNTQAAPDHARRLLGVVPHPSGIYSRLTAREHIRYFAQLHGMSPRQIAEREAALIAQLQMEHIADRRTEGFSQGERLKVAIARALVHDPKHILLDEPTNGLDVPATRAMRQIIRDMKAQGKCVLISTHIMQEVAALCDHIVIIAGGAVKENGTPDELRAKAQTSDLEEAFVRLIGSEEGLA